MALLHRKPTIPEYFKDYINKDVDLTSEPKQCCPFHKEATPSFSYSAEKQVCSCFGGCKLYGMDVIRLHQVNYKLSSREEAERSLNSLYGVENVVALREDNLEYLVNDERVYYEGSYQEALLLANTEERWLEMDYVMSKTPVDATELKELVKRWKMEQ